MDSVLLSTKRILGLDIDYTAYDIDIITHINAAFSILNQLGVGPEDGFFISGVTEEWSNLTESGLPDDQLNLIKTYVYLKVRFLFDPPTTSFLLSAMKAQIEEFEWRLNVQREVLVPTILPDPVEEEE